MNAQDTKLKQFANQAPITNVDSMYFVIKWSH